MVEGFIDPEYYRFTQFIWNNVYRIKFIGLVLGPLLLFLLVQRAPCSGHVCFSVMPEENQITVLT